MQIIKKLGKAQFKCWWEEAPTEIMELDFNPLLSEFNLRGKAYFLLHWQGVPFGFRQWGIYDCLKDAYFSIGTNATEISVPCKLLQIPDQFTNGKRPSAVICYQGSFCSATSNTKLVTVTPTV